MLGKVFAYLFIIGYIFACAQGKLSEAGVSIVSGCTDAINLCITLAGTMCLWNGIMNVLDSAGITSFFAKVTKPLFKLIYSDYAIENSLGFISTSFAANFLGLGSAALPLGIQTMKSLYQNTNKTAAICDCATFSALSTVPFQLIPTTLISLRSAHGSTEPFSIIIPIWICSAVTITFTAVLCRLCTYFIMKRATKNG